MAFVPMTLITTPLSYKLHRMKSFTGDRLYWQANLQRWVILRALMFVVGLGIMALLTSAEVPHFIALGVNGAAQAPFGYLAAEHWALAAA